VVEDRCTNPFLSFKSSAVEVKFVFCIPAGALLPFEVLI
jgi:hypothetical protein